MTTAGFPYKRSALRARIAQAETCVQSLRTTGRVGLDAGALADLLDVLARVARRRMDPDYEPEPDHYDGADDLVRVEDVW